MRRSRGKYRTTVISLVVSISLFVAMSSFVDLAFLAVRVFYEETDYQLHVRLLSGTEAYQPRQYDDARQLEGLEGVDKADILRIYNKNLVVPYGEAPYTSQYLKDFEWVDQEKDDVGISVASIGETSYRDYCGQLGLDPDETGGSAILVDGYDQTWTQDGKTVHREGSILDCRPGDVVTGTLDWEDGREEASFDLAAVTVSRPVCLGDYSGPFLVVSDSWMDDHARRLSSTVGVYLVCEDPDAVEETVASILSPDTYTITNQAAESRKEQAFYTMAAIFLYGFMAVIALIGVTNIFNTITTNMELRGREFAMLRSVGMTGREFRRMILLESLFCGGKALALGLPLGILLSLGFYRGLGSGLDVAYRLPWAACLVSTAAVMALLAGIMRYSMAKISRRDMIAAIVNENI